LSLCLTNHYTDWAIAALLSLWFGELTAAFQWRFRFTRRSHFITSSSGSETLVKEVAGSSGTFIAYICRGMLLWPLSVHGRIILKWVLN